MKTKTIFYLLAAQNLLIGALLYFGAEAISIAAGASAQGLAESTAGNMGLGASFVGMAAITYSIRNLTGDSAKSALKGWGIAGLIILGELVSRMIQNPDFTPPLGFLITGITFIILAFYSATKTA
ncbi:MAG: hypothetical protein ACPIA1_03720 [Flavobacteriaceae bacterium]